MLAQQDAATLTITPTGKGLGADVSGVDMRRLSDAEFAAIRRALHEHLVLRFRGYEIDDVQFQKLAERFGTLLASPSYTRSRANYNPDAPMVTVISNVMEDGKAVGEHGDGELLWHTDLGFEEIPSGLTFLLARVVPPSGGNTSFCNMYKALEALAPETRARIAGLGCKHQASHSSYGAPRPGYRDIETTDPRELPGPVHPLVRTHPETGRQALYLGRRFGGYVPGLPLARSEALLDELWQQVDRPENVWTQEWKVGDLIVWDNRCTMHRRDTFKGMGLRRMHRLTTLGERPV